MDLGKTIRTVEVELEPEKAPAKVPHEAKPEQTPAPVAP